MKAQPISNTFSEVWMLGTSNYGAKLTTYLGIPYCYAHFITEGRGIKESINIYKEEFRPSDLLKKSNVNLCIWALSSKDDETAKFLYS